MIAPDRISYLAKELKIDKERVIREYLEILILRELSQESWSGKLVFKGGTALRLAYGSPRFSGDLDFSLLSPLRHKTVLTWAESVTRKFDFLIRDVWEKRETMIV